MDNAIDKAIHDTDRVICENIGLKDNMDRGLLSQNILAQLRNFVEYTSLKIYSSSYSVTAIDTVNTKAALSFVRARGELGFLSRFHKLLQISASHYTLDGDGSERLMLKYYEYLLRIRKYLKENYGLTVLDKISDFPINQDPSSSEYREKISEKINLQNQYGAGSSVTDRYYIHKVCPFFVGDAVYYEVTFYDANDRTSKSNRVIAFTSIDIPDNYAARLVLANDSIDVFGQKMPIKNHHRLGAIN